jgi:hypothetical protein
LDKLRTAVNKCFENSAIETKPGRGIDCDDEDDVLATLNKIVDLTFATRIFEIPIDQLSLDNCISAHDTLLYCYRRILTILNEQYKEISAIGFGRQSQCKDITEIAMNWLGTCEEGNSNKLSNDNGKVDNYSRNQGVIELIVGINEVTKLNLQNQNAEYSHSKNDYEGMVIHSPNTITLYLSSPQLEVLLTSNICDATAGNYIYLLLIPNQEWGLSSRYGLLISKLLHWLDFITYRTGNTFISSVQDMILTQLTEHLSMVGKLLAFVASPWNTLEDDTDIQKELELFLETII